MANLEYLSIGKCAEILKDETFEYNGTECVVVSDAEECYRQGYKDAIDKACEFLKSYRRDYPDGTGYVAGIIDDETIED